MHRVHIYIHVFIGYGVYSILMYICFLYTFFLTPDVRVSDVTTCI